MNSSTTTRVRHVVAELTRYPVEILDAEADLESDLGIDSVKRVEILGRLREVMGLPADLVPPERGLSSISAISRFVDEALGVTAAAAPPPALRAPTHHHAVPQHFEPPRPAPIHHAAPQHDGLSWAAQSPLAAAPEPPRWTPPAAPAPSFSPPPSFAPAPQIHHAASQQFSTNGVDPSREELRAAVIDTLIEVLEETRHRMRGGPAPRSAPSSPPSPRGGRARPDLPDLRGRVALITGAGQGLGAAVALSMARQGCAVALVGQGDGAAVGRVAAQARADGADAVHLGGNLDEPELLRRVVQELRQRWGGLDYLITCASDAALAPTSQVTDDQWDRAFRAEVLALHQGALAVRPLMRARGGGKIIALSSSSAQRVLPQHGLIGPVKAAVESLVRYLAVDLGPENIQVNSLALGAAPTGDDKFIAPLMSLIAPGSEAITGAVLTVDHGVALPI